jgi:hypothetical protein
VLPSVDIHGDGAVCPSRSRDTPTSQEETIR